jgi:dTDP-4-amino-4,6-dideoxygalactose transaminase
VYLEKAFQATSFIPKKRLPIAKMLGDNSLMFLVHPTLTEENIKKAKEVIAEVLKVASP